MKHEMILSRARELVQQYVPLDTLPVQDNPVMLAGGGLLILVILLYLRKPLAAQLTRINPLRRHRLKKRIAAATEQVEQDVEDGSTPYDPERVRKHIQEAEEYVNGRHYREAHRELNKVENILL